MHITTPPQRPSVFKPDIPPLLEQTILEMLDKDPDKRPSLNHLRNVFAELVATGDVQLEPGSTSTFRSELMRRRGDSESRTPKSNPRNRDQTPSPPTARGVAAPPSAALAAEPRRRAPSEVEPRHRAPSNVEPRHRAPSNVDPRRRAPSNAPTQIAFTPGPDTLTPAEAPTKVRAAVAPPTALKKSRRGLILTIVLLAATVPMATIAIAMLKHKQPTVAPDAAADVAPDAAAHVAPDAAIIANTVDAAAVVAALDAAVVAAPDAAVVAATNPPVAKREVVIRISIPIAKLEIDGVPVENDNGLVRVALTDGLHRIRATAPGYVLLRKTIVVSAAEDAFGLTLEPKQTQPGAGSAAGPGSGSGGGDSNYTIDPFKD
jgi:hypothetical protein